MKTTHHAWIRVLFRGFAAVCALVAFAAAASAQPQDGVHRVGSGYPVVFVGRDGTEAIERTFRVEQSSWLKELTDALGNSDVKQAASGVTVFVAGDRSETPVDATLLKTSSWLSEVIEARGGNSSWLDSLRRE